MRMRMSIGLAALVALCANAALEAKMADVTAGHELYSAITTQGAHQQLGTGQATITDMSAMRQEAATTQLGKQKQTTTTGRHKHDPVLVQNKSGSPGKNLATTFGQLMKSTGAISDNRHTAMAKESGSYMRSYLASGLKTGSNQCTKSMAFMSATKGGDTIVGNLLSSEYLRMCGITSATTSGKTDLGQANLGTERRSQPIFAFTNKFGAGSKYVFLS